MKRRDFLKLNAAGVATLMLSSRIPGLGVRNAFAADQTLEITITDIMKDMVTHNQVNPAQCYFWVYQMKANGVDIPVECPGPTIYGQVGDTITITKITNNLDEAHNFVIPGIFDSGPIPANSSITLTAPNGVITLTDQHTGAHLYHDTLNAPVNRVMGLHGAMVVQPAVPVGNNKVTPYANPTQHVQDLYNAFGDANVYPGLAWGEGDPATNCPARRTYVWLIHQASPNLFAEVGNHPAGQDYPAQEFRDKFLREPLNPTNSGHAPQYYTINGQSGFFSHFSPGITPMGRVGEPVVLHLMNAGLQTHSMHMHCNHFYITSINGVVNTNPIWVDVYGILPMDRIDYTFPYMRPPDTFNARGIGKADTPLTTSAGSPYWPPQQEMATHFPPLGTTALAQDGVTPVELGQRLSPLCYPAHDHLEPSQTSQGGNYNMGAIGGAYITGDRNTQGWMNFPMDADFASMYRNIRGLAVPGSNGGANATRESAGPRPNNG